MEFVFGNKCLGYDHGLIIVLDPFRKKFINDRKKKSKGGLGAICT